MSSLNELQGNKLIIRNTLLLYFRQFIVLFVALFTSRVVLKTLGIEDYGIYGVVGGIVSLFGFINASLSSATSRFITYEIGKGNDTLLRDTFSSAVLCHFCIALVVIVLSETIGLWFLQHKMVIPDGRFGAALWVFHLSIISAAIGITQVPYSASIISHERIDIYAYLEIVSVFLKLLIVYLLTIGTIDKLILYSVLNFLLTIGVAMYYRIYCLRRFQECHFSHVINRPLLKRMLSFSGWDLFGNLSVSARTQGVAILINMFFGVAANAASSIASQVQGAVMTFSSNILISVKPQIIKSFAADDYIRTKSLLINSTLVILYLMCLITLPLVAEIDFVLDLWLVEVPPYCSVFCSLVLVFNLFSALAMLYLTISHAAEKNKLPSLINGTMYIMAVPITYAVFRLSSIVWFPYFYNVLTMLIGLVIVAKLACKYLPVLSVKEVFTLFLKNGLLILFTYGVLVLIRISIDPSWWRFLLVVFTSTASLLLLALFVGINRDNRNELIRFFKTKKWKELFQ